MMNNKYDFEQIRNILESSIENNLSKVKDLLSANFISGNEYYQTYVELAQAVNELPETDEYFLEWLLLDSPDLYASAIQMSTLVMAIQNCFSNVSSDEA